MFYCIVWSFNCVYLLDYQPSLALLLTWYMSLCSNIHILYTCMYMYICYVDTAQNQCRAIDVYKREMSAGGVCIDVQYCAKRDQKVHLFTHWWFLRHIIYCMLFTNPAINMIPNHWGLHWYHITWQSRDKNGDNIDMIFSIGMAQDFYNTGS